MADVVEYIVKLKDDMSASISNLTKHTEHLNKTVEHTQNVVHELRNVFFELFAAQKVIEFIGESTKAFSENREASAQLAATIKSTNNAMGLSSEALEQQSKALAKTSMYEDGAITRTQALLGTFTNIKGVIFTDAMPAIVNLSAKMKTDLQSSAIQVGKALNDPIKGITALKRVGVSFSESQQNVIKSLVETGQVAKAQQMIIKELNTEFGGSAAAARGAATPFERIKHDIRPIIEEIGGVFVKLQEKIMPVFENVMGFIEKLISNPVIIGAVDRIYKTFTNLFGFLQGKFEKVFESVGGFMPTLEKVFEFVATLFDTIETAYEQIYTALEPIISIVMSVFKTIFDYMMKHLPVIEGMFAFLGKTLKVVADVLVFVLKPILLVVKGVIEGIIWMLDKMMTGVEWVMRKAGLIKNNLPSTVKSAAKKSETAKGGGGGAGGLGLNAPPTEMSAGKVTDTKPTIINITMGSLVNTFTVGVTNLQEGSAKVREEILKAMISAVNDSQVHAIGNT
jgi:hypothetical protein